MQIKNDINKSTLMEILDKIRLSIETDADSAAQKRNEVEIADMGQSSAVRFSLPVLLALEYVRMNHIDSELSIDEIARHAHLSAGHLRTLFKKETGKTIGDYITEMRIAESKRLLQSTFLKINEISERVGYSSGRYFSQVFYKQTGTFPSDFRRGEG